MDKTIENNLLNKIQKFNPKLLEVINSFLKTFQESHINKYFEPEIVNSINYLIDETKPVQSLTAQDIIAFFDLYAFIAPSLCDNEYKKKYDEAISMICDFYKKVRSIHPQRKLLTVLPGITTATIATLHSNKIFTIADLSKYSKQDICNLKGFGREKQNVLFFSIEQYNNMFPLECIVLKKSSY
ncbi:MAG: hypothetical protein RSB76_02445 [Clostridia bacterium]